MSWREGVCAMQRKHCGRQRKSERMRDGGGDLRSQKIGSKKKKVGRGTMGGC